MQKWFWFSDEFLSSNVFAFSTRDHIVFTRWGKSEKNRRRRLGSAGCSQEGLSPVIPKIFHILRFHEPPSATTASTCRPHFSLSPTASIIILLRISPLAAPWVANAPSVWNQVPRNGWYIITKAWSASCSLSASVVYLPKFRNPFTSSVLLFSTLYSLCTTAWSSALSSISKFLKPKQIIKFLCSTKVHDNIVTFRTCFNSYRPSNVRQSPKLYLKKGYCSWIALTVTEIYRQIFQFIRCHFECWLQEPICWFQFPHISL